MHKTALGAENSVPWFYFESPSDAALKIKSLGVKLVAIEQTKLSKSIYEISTDFPVCFIVGNEVSGVSEELAKLADEHIEIPMRGVKQSLNVSVATGIIGYEFARRFLSSQ